MPISKSCVWFMPFLFFALGYIGAHILLSQPTQPMPNLIGMLAHDALGVLSSHHLNPRILGYKYDPDVMPGTILSQTPIPDVSIKAHQSVFLVLAHEPQSSIMPQCIQCLITNTQSIANTIGTAPTIYYLSHSWPLNTCFAQFPCAGHKIPKNLKSILYVSSGIKQRVIWPSFIGMELSKAQALLQHKGMTPDIISTNPVLSSVHSCNSYITDQRPLAFSLVDITTPDNVSVQLRVAYID